MGYHWLEAGAGILAFVSVVAWVVQWVGAMFVEGKVWRKLTAKREPETVWYRGAGVLRPRRDRIVQLPEAPTSLAPTQASDSAGTKALLNWANDLPHWQDRAGVVRTTFLQRTQGTAEKWRNIFAALLGVFGAVFVIDKPSIADASDPDLVRYAILIVIALALNAVAYTGWAAAGLPKMLVDVDAYTTFEAEMRQGARALARLRVGITAGGLTAVGLTLVVAALLQ